MAFKEKQIFHMILEPATIRETSVSKVSVSSSIVNYGLIFMNW